MAAALIAALAAAGCAGAEAVGTSPTVLATSSISASSAPQLQPVALRIASIGVETALDELTLTPAGGLDVPENPQRAGWYAGGAVPGEVGPAVVAGHVDSQDGPAVFYRLADLHEGDDVYVDLSDGRTVAFDVQSLAQVGKDEFPTAAVYGPTPERGLRLITCGGTFDRSGGHYRDNVVVFAAFVPG